MLDIANLKAHAQTRQVAAGQLVMSRSALPTTVSYLDGGRVALGVWQGDSLVHQLGALDGPCWLDLSATVLHKPPVMDAVALSPLDVSEVSRADVDRVLGQLSTAARILLVDMAIAHRRQSDYALSRLAKDAASRCAEWLLSHAVRRQGDEWAVELVEHKRSIAAHLGITPETFSRVLRHLRDQSLISGSGRLLRLTDPKALRAVAEV